MASFVPWVVAERPRFTCGRRVYEFTIGGLSFELSAHRCKRWLGGAGVGDRNVLELEQGTWWKRQMKFTK